MPIFSMGILVETFAPSELPATAERGAGAKSWPHCFPVGNKFANNWCFQCPCIVEDLRPVLPGNASHETALAAGARVFTGRNIFSLARHFSRKLIPSDSHTLVCQSKHRESPAAAPQGAALRGRNGTSTIPVHRQTGIQMDPDLPAWVKAGHVLEHENQLQLKMRGRGSVKKMRWVSDKPPQPALRGLPNG